MPPLQPASRPTLHFIGVTTGQSSILRVFPGWVRALGLGDAAINGIDLPIGAPPEDYRAVVAFIARDPLSLGALVTTHKIDLFGAARDLFGFVDPHAALTGEASCLSKRDGVLRVHAKDPISSGLALGALVPEGHFGRTGGEAFCIGCGGSATAITWHLMHGTPDRPARITVSDRDPARLEAIGRAHRAMGATVPLRYVLAEAAADNDAVAGALPAGSLVVNASGLGKDRPGSPLTDDAAFPAGGLAWDLNYRGDLRFLAQARRRADALGLTVADGWTYFLHGWTQVIAEVFAIAIPPSGPRFAELSAIAAAEGR